MAEELYIAGQLGFGRCENIFNTAKLLELRFYWFESVARDAILLRNSTAIVLRLNIPLPSIPLPIFGRCAGGKVVGSEAIHSTCQTDSPTR